MSQKTNWWFVKSRRAQSVDDYETWMGGGMVPTLNQFDGGDTRATVLIFYGNRVDDIRIQGEVVNTLQARMGTGGGNMPLVFSHTQGLDIQASEIASPTLRAGGAGMAVAYPIQDGRGMNKEQNGLGLGDEVDPSYTLDATGAQSVAYSLREDAKADTFSATQTDKALALQGLQPSPQSHHAQIFLAQASTVRRLTPTECERLQGFPDGWTEGQADTHRYKQMGNAVAVPCVSWIVGRMVEAIGD